MYDDAKVLGQQLRQLRSKKHQEEKQEQDQSSFEDFYYLTGKDGAFKHFTKIFAPKDKK